MVSFLASSPLALAFALLVLDVLVLLVLEVLTFFSVFASLLAEGVAFSVAVPVWPFGAAGSAFCACA